MSRISFFLTTLIAALPAAFLGYVCVMAFLTASDKMSPILMAVAGITLLLCVAVIAMPVAVLLQGRRGEKAVAPTPKKGGSDEAAEGEATEAVGEEEVATASAEDEDVFVEGGADEFEVGDDFEAAEEPRKKKK